MEEFHVVFKCDSGGRENKLLKKLETHTLPGDVHAWCARIFLSEFNLRAKLGSSKKSSAL